MHSSTHPTQRHLSTALGLAALMALSGCDYLGIEPASKAVEGKVAEGKAIGGACRHANRALEDCYRYNPKANKAAVFDGWKDMDVYMRENKLDTIAPVTPPEAAKKPAAKSADDEIITETDDKPAEKAADKKPAAAKK
jgi:hypothetical protein